jgi:IS30 family transposase
MKRLQHLTSIERDKITILQGEGLSIRKIAKELGRSPSTISRELNRPEALYYRGKYIGSQTDKRVKANWKKSHERQNHYLSLRWVQDFIKNCLKIGWSPEIISHELNDKHGISLSHETLYIYIYSPKRNLSQFLLRRKYGRISKNNGERPKRIGTGKNIPNRIDISERPKDADERLVFGHFEADSIESCKKRGETLPCLTVIVERVSRYTKIMKTTSKTAQATTTSIVTALKPFANNVISITYDNGCEFSQHEKVNDLLNTKSYFARPYCSNDKGTVENINGLIRRFFPKGTNFDNISEEAIAYVEDWINNRPMKILNYMTPKQIFQLNSVAIAS